MIPLLSAGQVAGTSFLIFIILLIAALWLLGHLVQASLNGSIIAIAIILILLIWLL